MKRIVIIGAGPCGLAALKEMLAAGHEATIIERSAVLGGTFASAKAYPNLHLTISNWLMAFSDFPALSLVYCQPCTHNTFVSTYLLEHLRAKMDLENSSALVPRSVSQVT